MADSILAEKPRVTPAVPAKDEEVYDKLWFTRINIHTQGLAGPGYANLTAEYYNGETGKIAPRTGDASVDVAEQLVIHDLPALIQNVPSVGALFSSFIEGLKEAYPDIKAYLAPPAEASAEESTAANTETESSGSVTPMDGTPPPDDTLT